MWLYVALGGAGGALGRYALMMAVGKRLGDAFPYATLAVNVLGSFAMGALVAMLARYLPPMQNEIRHALAIGFLGAFTTFSTFSLDVLTLYERGQWGAASVYIVLSVILCVSALATGLYIFRPTLG
ncbi:MAG: fluoride efflux transporter CrcB [Alphaproteobacteria bacterium]|nr:fluoride efflux transporter CrcB [Alphaproteobacteria bacterium]